MAQREASQLASRLAVLVILCIAALVIALVKLGGKDGFEEGGKRLASTWGRFPVRGIENRSRAPSEEPKHATDVETAVSTAVNGRVSTLRVDADAIRTQNVCYEYGTNSIVVFTDHESDLARVLAKTPVGRNLRMHVKWRQEPSSSWSGFLKRAKGVLNSKSVLFFPDGELPAHCLHDFLFSAFLVEKEGLRFDEYLSKSNPARGCNPDRNWCCFVFERAGIVLREKATAYSPPVSCYSSLTHLVFGAARFAPDWSTIPEKEHLDLYAHDSGSFPLEHLKSLHAKIHSYNKDFQLSRRPIHQRRTRTNVLILDRTEAKRRIWTNGRTLASMLVTGWGELSSEKLGSVMYYGAGFGELTPLEQARLFYKADVIISPHGAQLSNLIFGQGGRTCVVEVMCSEGQGENKFEQVPAEGVLNWFGVFPVRLGMQAYTFASPGASCSHFGRNFSVDVDVLFAKLKQSSIFRDVTSASNLDSTDSGLLGIDST